MPLPVTTTTHAYRFGSHRFGFVPYGGLSRSTTVPTRNVSGIIFLTSNDRYQVVSCSYGGTLDVAPEFRYWYAAPAPWAEELSNDEHIPPFYSQDEDGTIPVGSIELPYRAIKNPQEERIAGVLVEFIPRPSSLDSDSVWPVHTVGFSVRVEGQGVQGYQVAGSGGGNVGIVTSNTCTFSEDVDEHGSSPWPNVRTEFFPCRLSSRVRAARVVITDLQLIEIVSVSLMGANDIAARTR